MSKEYGNFLRRTDLVRNQVERERIREQQAAKSRSKLTQQQNARRYADYQRVLRAELEARIFHNVLSVGGETDSIITIDPDAQAFITAASITDPTQQAAINTLVTDLKGYSIWTKFSAIYPFVGGTATTHKFNLKNPLDTDAAFRLVFSGGWTHSTTGALPNGTNAYADTFLNASLHTSQNSVHLSYYSRTSTGGGQTEMGHFTAGNGLYLIYSYDGFKALNSLSFQIGTSFTPTNGMLIGSRIDSTTEKYYHKGVLSNTVSKASTVPQNSKVFIGANNVSGSASQFSSKQTAFASIGDGLTDTEAANFYTAVQTFQTTLNRNI